MSESRAGQIVTFYSYKGGTGRTMALSNVAWILAAAGRRVLMADWDLEAPGLHRFFSPFVDVDSVAHTPGVIDMVREYEDHVMREVARPEDWVAQLARVDNYARAIDWNFGGGGSLSLLSAGRQDDGTYASTLGSIDWDTFYDRLGGVEFLDALRADMRHNYDFTLIDSRTGFSDVADICTMHLPDVLVDCFTLSEQGLDGAARVANAVASLSRRSSRAIRILPVTMRVDQGEKEKADAGRLRAMRRFAGLPAGMTEQERIEFFASVEVPYQTFYAYEETLATFGDRPGSPMSLLSAYERLTDVITEGGVQSLAPIDESVRAKWLRRFERSVLPEQDTIILRYASEDQVWAEWVGSVLAAVGVGVVDGGPLEIAQVERDLSSRSSILAIVSNRGFPVLDHFADAAMLLAVDEVRLPAVPVSAKRSIFGLDASAAAKQLLTLVGRFDSVHFSRDEALARFPGSEPKWFQAPARNARFTGRIEELHRIRADLRDMGRPVTAVALQGLGGIGKTQLALEYAHRFRCAYDLVWWIQADPPQFVGAALADLSMHLGLPSEDGAIATTPAALEALRRGTVARRWLLVFDNADDFGVVQDFIPQGGHVLITSRNADWAERATRLQVDVFERRESVAHLRGRSRGLTQEHAERVAEALGDLPIAVAAAGAWLAETGTPVDDYLNAIQDHGAGVRSVHATWDLSLERLKGRSPGAYRLLQVCSVLAPEIALELIYSDRLMDVIKPLDPSVGARDMRGALVQELNRLALVKIDTFAGQMQIHRLVQEVVGQRMTDDEAARIRHAAHMALAAFRPVGEPDDPATWSRFRMIWPHLEVSGAMACDEELVRQLFIDHVRYLWRRGDYVSARSFGVVVEAAWEEASAQGAHPIDGGATQEFDAVRRQLLLLRFNIANVLRDQAQFEDALRLDEEVLIAQRGMLGEGHAHTLMTAGGLAADLRALGRYAEALPLEEATNRIWSDRFGEDHPRTLASSNNLAVSLRSVGDFRTAMSIDENVLDRRRILLGPTHPYTLHSQASVGRDLREAGEYERSVALLRNVVSLSIEHLGAESVGTLNAQASLAASLRAKGDLQEAADLLDDAYAKLKERYGSGGPNTLACQLNRSVNMLVMGTAAEAFEEIVGIRATYESALGRGHPPSLVCLINQSAAERQLNEIGRAKDLAARAVQGCFRTLGEGHPYYLAAAMNWAACRYESGDVDGAKDDLVELRGRMATVFGDEHPHVLFFRANYAVIAQQDLGEAMRTAIDHLATVVGASHPLVRSISGGRLHYQLIDPPDPF